MKPPRLQGVSPRRLFHAVVLVGASFGAASCGTRSLAGPGVDAAAMVGDGGGDRTEVALADAVWIDVGDRDASAGDAADEALLDAGCDVACHESQVNVNCRCITGIL